MSRQSQDRYLRCMGRDIHLAPIQFLLTEPDMLRQYGGRVLLFNTNSPRTREALSSARETPNDYILVSQDVHLNVLEACFNLDRDMWDFPYTPETTVPQHIRDHGIEEATHILHYYSQVVHREEMTLGDLPAAHRQVLRDIENHYYAHLRYPGETEERPEDRTAGTTASIAREAVAKDAAIDSVVREVYLKHKEQKQRIEAKSMPKEHPVPDAPAASSTTPQPVKGPPAIVLEQRAKEAAAKKHKHPPKKLLEQLQKRPSADTPAKASTDVPKASADTPAKASTDVPMTKADTTVKLEPKQPKHPPPPKRPADRVPDNADANLKRTKPKQEDIPTPPAARRQSQNKMPTPPATPIATTRAIPPAPTRPAPSPPSRAGPIPPEIPEPPRPPHARSRTPAPPNPPKRAQPPNHPPPGRTRQDPYADIPTPPAPPRHSGSERPDTTDRRQPLPRQRQEEVQETFYPDFELRFNENVNLEQFIETMDAISTTAPDPEEERTIRRRIWYRLVELADQGISTGSRQLDRMIRSGIDSVDLTEDVYDIDYVPSPEEHFLRQDPGEQGKMYRPRLMTHIEEDEWSVEVLMRLRDLGRNVLAGRAVCRDHPLYDTMEFHNVSTYYLSIVVLNLGNIIRQPRFANNYRYPSEIRNNEERLRENLILPHLVLNNPGHIITLNESYDFTAFRNLCIEYQ